VLDRLLDDEPLKRQEAPLTRAQSIRIMKAAVARDLESLLNSRCSVDSPPDAFNEVQRSVYMYGLPDFSSYGVRSPRDRDRLLRSIQRAVEMFEPRLTQVAIVPREVQEQSRLILNFTIQALLMLDPVPEEVAYDTVCEVGRGEYQVSGV
jgi:type VI secretion system protein ImpF